jgi:hypothetical protein
MRNKACLLGCDTVQPNPAEVKAAGSSHALVNFYQTAKCHTIEYNLRVTTMKISNLMHSTFSTCVRYKDGQIC